MGLAQEIQKRDEFDCPEQETALNLYRTSAIVSEPHDRLFKSRGISQPLYNILRILRGHGGSLACSEIGSQMITRVPDTTRLIDRLERLGFVRRQRSEGDRRVVLVGLTDRGRALVGELDEPVVRLHRETLGHLSADELQDLNRLLTKARKADAD